MPRAHRSKAGLGPVFDFMRVVWALDHALQRSSKRMQRTIGVTGRQRLALRLLGKLPGISAGELAEVLHLHPSTLTWILERLERRGLLRRVVDVEDGRRALLRLTKRGRQYDIEAEGTIEAAVRRTFAGISPRDIAVARTVLQRLTRTLELHLDRQHTSDSRQAS